MKQISRLLSALLILTLLFLSGCEKKPEGVSGESQIRFTESSLDSSVTYLPTDFETLYPGKKKLVWLLNDNALGNDPAVFMRLNELLE